MASPIEEHRRNLMRSYVRELLFSVLLFLAILPVAPYLNRLFERAFGSAIEWIGGISPGLAILIVIALVFFGTLHRIQSLTNVER